MAKTIWRGARGQSRPVKQSKTVSVYGKPLPSADSHEEHERIFKHRREINIPIPGEWLVDTRLKSEMPKLGLCKIRTERIRNMTLQQKERALFFLGPTTKAERTSLSNPRGLLHNFLWNLISVEKTEPLSERSREAYIKTYGEEPMPESKIVAGYKSEANRVEMQIWDAQAKKSCPIATLDVAARDYIREKREAADPEVVDKIRGKRRPKIR